MSKKDRKKKAERESVQRSIVYAIENESVYGIIIKALGQGRFEVKCSDMFTRIASLAGKLRKRVWVQANDYVLISLRPDESKKGDIICKYLPPEVKILRESRELPENFGEQDDENADFQFEDL